MNMPSTLTVQCAASSTTFNLPQVKDLENNFQKMDISKDSSAMVQNSAKLENNSTLVFSQPLCNGKNFTN